MKTFLKEETIRQRANKLCKAYAKIWNKSPLAHNIVSDDAWQNARQAMNYMSDNMAQYGVSLDFHHKYHDYGDNGDNGMPTSKTWDVDIYDEAISTEEPIANGWFKCFGAGTLDDIFSRYDMASTVFPNKEFGLNESRLLKNTIRLTESELHNLISETVQKVLKEYDDFDLDYLGDTVNGAPLSRSRFRNNRYGSEPVTDYLKQAYGNYEKDNSPMGFFKISFNDPHKKTPISIKSISYKKLQCLKNDLEEKFGDAVGEVIISKTKSFSEEERKIDNRKIEQIYKHLLNANW